MKIKKNSIIFAETSARILMFMMFEVFKLLRVLITGDVVTIDRRQYQGDQNRDADRGNGRVKRGGESIVTFDLSLLFQVVGAVTVCRDQTRFYLNVRLEV